MAAEIARQLFARYQKEIPAGEVTGKIEVILQLGQPRIALIQRVPIGVKVHEVGDVNPHLFEDRHELRRNVIPVIADPVHGGGKVIMRGERLAAWEWHEIVIVGVRGYTVKGLAAVHATDIPEHRHVLLSPGRRIH